MAVLLFAIGTVLLFVGTVADASPDPAFVESYCPDGATDPECVDHAGDYVLTGFKQTEPLVVFVYYAAGAPFGAQTAAVAAGVDEWGTDTSSTTNTAMAPGVGAPATHLCGGGNGAPMPNGLDGQNTIIWAPIDGLAIGRACWSGADEADIVLDSGWPGFANGEATRTVVLHEVGHALGLGHTPVAAAVMFASYSSPKALHADDLAGFCAIYGCTGGGTPTPPPPPTGTATHTPTATATSSPPTATPTQIWKRCGAKAVNVNWKCAFVPGLARD